MSPGWDRLVLVTTGLLLLVMSVALHPAGARPTIAAAPVTVAPDSLAGEMIDRLNAERTALGLEPLAFSEAARAVAVERAVDMATHTYFAHISPLGVAPDELLDRTGVHYTRMGENIARSTATSEQVVDAVHCALMASPGHRAHMLQPAYTHVGIGIASAGGRFYVAEILLG